MWFATEKDLNRYDGHNVKRYKLKYKANAATFYTTPVAFLIDKAGTFWVGTRSGLMKYVPGKDDFVQLEDQFLKHKIVRALFEDKSGKIWIGTNKGLYIFNYETGSISPFESAFNLLLPQKDIYCIYQDSRGVIWLGTNSGLVEIKNTNGKFASRLFQKQPGRPGGLSDNQVTAIVEDNENRLWLGTQKSGLELYDAKENSFSHIKQQKGSNGLAHNSIRKIMKDANGQFWIGTQDGLSILNPADKTFKTYRKSDSKNSLSQNSIYCIYRDVNGSVWIGTYFGGVNVTHAYHTPFRVLHGNNNTLLTTNIFSSIVVDNGEDLWLGTEGGGVLCYNAKQKTVDAFRKIPNDRNSLGSNLVKVVYKDKKEQIWVGTHGGGLNLYDRKSKSFTRPVAALNKLDTSNLEILSLLNDSKNRFWVGTNTGLKVFSEHENTFKSISDSFSLEGPGIVINTLLEDSKNRIWIGSEKGLYLIENYNTTEVSEKIDVNCIIESQNGILWLGINSVGLGRLDPQDKKIKIYSQKDGLVNKNVLGILEDKNNDLWLSTDNGLAKFDPRTSKFQSYSIADGLAGNEFNYHSYCKDKSGKFYFGGYNGITCFFPDSIEINDTRSPIVFTDFKVFDKSVFRQKLSPYTGTQFGAGNVTKLNYNENTISINFSLLNYIKSDKNLYLYRLEGFDSNWHSSNKTEVNYNKLSRGTYTFVVKGRNNDGVWSEPIFIKFNIHPPFWLTWWAWCIYIGLFGLILFLVIRFLFIRALYKKDHEIHQLKLNFFTNISHEIRSHLTLILAPIEKVLEDKKLNLDSRNQLENVKSNSDRLLSLVNELLDFRKAETNHLSLCKKNDDLIYFLQEIYSSFRQLSLAKNISMSFTHNEKIIMLSYDKVQLEKVFFNLLSNAFKFTPEGGKISLSVEKDKNNVEIKILDNGIGIAEEFQDRLFDNFYQVAEHEIQNTGYGIGLALAKNIVELHNGIITVTSSVATQTHAGFTCFTINLPLNIDANELNGDIRTPTEKKSFAVDKDLEIPCQTDDYITGSTTAIGSTPHKRKETVLVVEDNDELRKMVAQTFINTHKVVECENGKVAWQYAIQHIPDLIISDIMMPELNGEELCKKIKQDERTSHIPVILLTAKSSQTDVITGLETGAEVYITKPFSLRALFLNARNLLTSKEKLRKKINFEIVSSPVPGSHETSPLSKLDQEFLHNISLLVEEHLDDPDFGIDMICRKVGMSRPVLYKKVKSLTDMSVNEFIKTIKLKKAAQLLKQRELTVNEICYAIGYSDRRYFTQEFKKHFGLTPTEFAKSGNIDQ